MPSSSSGTTRKSSTNKNCGSKYSSPLISLRKSIATFLRGLHLCFYLQLPNLVCGRRGALALCAVCLAGTVTAAVRLAGKSVAASATVQTTIENTQDIGTYFTGYGFEVDLSTAAVDKVKIPKKWDDSFTAFNQVVGESGLTLADYKGKTVEKWTVLCPARSDGSTDTYCVLLVYKAKPVGAYLLEKPSGEVSGLITAAQTAAEAEQQAAETSAALPDEADYPSE